VYFVNLSKDLSKYLLIILKKMEAATISKTTLVIGASDNEERYSNMAVKLIKYYNHHVLAVGNKETSIDNVEVKKGTPAFENVHTITLYLSSKNQEPLYDYILGLLPKRIIFNPGTENDVLVSLASEKGIETIEACTLVMLKTNQF
jgi:predicted CoA-binding protein